MRDNYYRLGEGFLIVYSITMRDTFTDVNRFHDHILSVKGVEDVPLIVVGSKCDLGDFPFLFFFFFFFFFFFRWRSRSAYLGG
jgi:GTPase SAR1 family protein